MQVLISGASIAGPTLAYWLTRNGWSVTVVEQAPALRRTGGHAVDLFGPAVDVVERMGLLPRIEELAVRTSRLSLRRHGAGRAVSVDLGALTRAASDRHVEVLRDDASGLLYEATRHDTEYIFGDSVTAITEDGEVTFEQGRSRPFDLVIGADGLHSAVRRIVFGPASERSHYLGAYLAVVSVPAAVPEGMSVGHIDVGRAATLYGTRDPANARVVFAFDSEHDIGLHHGDVAGQKDVLRARFAGMHDDVAGWLAALDHTPAFYFDAITQVRMDTWSRGRVTLVGDAGYAPGPVVGGGTSLAVLGAYVLAGELAAAGGNPEAAFAAYERELAGPVAQSRALAADAVRNLLPRSAVGVHALVQGARLVSALPAPLRRSVVRRASTRGNDETAIKDYPVLFGA